jgi:hypothetical protein
VFGNYEGNPVAPFVPQGDHTQPGKYMNVDQVRFSRPLPGLSDPILYGPDKSENLKKLPQYRNPAGNSPVIDPPGENPFLIVKTAFQFLHPCIVNGMYVNYTDIGPFCGNPGMIPGEQSEHRVIPVRIPAGQVKDMLISEGIWHFNK